MARGITTFLRALLSTVALAACLLVATGSVAQAQAGGNSAPAGAGAGGRPGQQAPTAPGRGYTVSYLITGLMVAAGIAAVCRRSYRHIEVD